MKRNAALVFAKAQASAFTGGIVDYAMMVLCTELLHIHYTISILISGIIGAGVNFLLNRFVVFRSTEERYFPQLRRFVWVVLGSIVLKSSGTYLFTNTFHLDYKISRLAVDLVVSLAFNFVLQKFWVFKKHPSSTDY